MIDATGKSKILGLKRLIDGMITRQTAERQISFKAKNAP